MTSSSSSSGYLNPTSANCGRHDPSPAAVKAEFGPAVDDTHPTDVILVLQNDRPIGLMQSYLIGDHPEWLGSLQVVNP